MQNKLQELTDKLYEEGLAKGRNEGEQILSRAKEQAALIVSQAQKQSEEILENARREADACKAKVERDIKLASAQSLAQTKQSLEGLLVNKIVCPKVDEILTDSSFIKELIVCVAKGFSKDGATELEVILPEKLRAQAEAFAGEEISALVASGTEVSFSTQVKGGFRIGQKGEDWFVSFTDESFKQLICNYLRPVTRKVLFGE